jgi:hypothetical protein
MFTGGECAGAWPRCHKALNESAAETSRYQSVSVAWFEGEVAEITLIDEFMRLCALHNSFGPSRYNR